MIRKGSLVQINDSALGFFRMYIGKAFKVQAIRTKGDTKYAVIGNKTLIPLKAVTYMGPQKKGKAAVA